MQPKVKHKPLLKYICIDTFRGYHITEVQNIDTGQLLWVEVVPSQKVVAPSRIKRPFKTAADARAYIESITQKKLNQTA